MGIDTTMDTTGTVITVEARVIGQRRPLIPAWEVALGVPPGSEGGEGLLRLRELLALVVRREVAAFRQRQEDRRLIRILSPDEIGQGRAAGKIAMGGVDADTPPAEVEEGAAVSTALQAFADGLYFVFIDGVQYQDLDAAVTLRPRSTLTFIRLVALAGG